MPLTQNTIIFPASRNESLFCQVRLFLLYHLQVPSPISFPDVVVRRCHIGTLWLLQQASHVPKKGHPPTFLGWRTVRRKTSQDIDRLPAIVRWYAGFREVNRLPKVTNYSVAKLQIKLKSIWPQGLETFLPFHVDPSGEIQSMPQA